MSLLKMKMEIMYVGEAFIAISVTQMVEDPVGALWMEVALVRVIIIQI